MSGESSRAHSPLPRAIGRGRRSCSGSAARPCSTDSRSTSSQPGWTMRQREPGAIAATPVTGLSLGAYLELIKPRITTLVVLTTATGLSLAPERPSFRTALFTVLGTILVVAAANVFNMYLERDTDALMPRTMNRPLPAGRIDPACALLFGVLLAAISVPLLTFVVGPLPGLLSALALVIYALVYTPLKRRATASLLVGAVAGAIPPLIGVCEPMTPQIPLGSAFGPRTTARDVLGDWRLDGLRVVITGGSAGVGLEDRGGV